MITDYAWEDGQIAGNHLYFEVQTGRIVGEVSRIGMSGNRSSCTSFVVIGKDEYLGNYINARHAKNAVERYTLRHNMILDGNILEHETQHGDT
jgi:hypothetical protein